MRIITRATIILIILLISACQALPNRGQPGGGAPPTPVTPNTAAVIAPSPALTATITIRPTDTVVQAGSAATPTPFGNFQTRWHPDGPLFVGDKLSLEVFPAPAESFVGKTLQVQLMTEQGEQVLDSRKFEDYGLGSRVQATFWWFWDTGGLEAGDYSIKFTILPGEYSWQETVTLLPASLLPENEAGAQWREAHSECCQVYYLSGTAAERDIDSLLAVLDRKAAWIAEKLGAVTEEKIPIVLLPRVLGHGGFSAKSIAVSYLDRNYAGSGSEMVLHHELVHWLDSKLGGEVRPSLLVEGLAVYLTGGHFKQEAVFHRAAALLPPSGKCLAASPGASQGEEELICGLGRFIPLKELVDNFYPSQHEIGYIEAGALVEFMINRWGWQAFSDFYRDIHPVVQTTAEQTGPVSQLSALDAALSKHFDINLETLERLFIAALEHENLSPEVATDVHLSIDYYDTLRRYQQLLDPSAYFLFAWLADSEVMRARAITADYLRHPAQEENIVLELMFVAADAALRAGDYNQAARILEAIQDTLDQITARSENPLAVNPLVNDYAGLAQAVQRAGYQPERIEMGENDARVWASAGGPDLSLFQFIRSLHGWQIVETVNTFFWGAPDQLVGSRAGIQPAK